MLLSRGLKKQIAKTMNDDSRSTDGHTDTATQVSECRCPAADNRTTSDDDNDRCLFAAFLFCSSSLLLIMTAMIPVSSIHKSHFITRHWGNESQRIEFEILTSLALIHHTFCGIFPRPLRSLARFLATEIHVLSGSRSSQWLKKA